MTTHYPELLHHLLERGEGPCVEFKEGNADPERIGKYISALSNMASCLGESEAYLVFGIRDEDRSFVGTDVDFDNMKVGSVPLRFYLEQTLSPKGIFEVVSWEQEGKRAVLVKISPAFSATTTFKGEDFGRIGSSLVSLGDHPALRAKVWEKILFSVSELSVALSAKDRDEVLDILDAEAFYKALGYRFPEEKEPIITRFLGEGFLLARQDGQYDITILGALCLAKTFSAFPRLCGKGIEIVTYGTDSRISSTGVPKRFDCGFLLSFGEAVEAIETAMGAKEEIRGAYRVRVNPIPEITIREMLSNAVLHQDISSPAPILVECFPSRLEIHNEGKLEVAPDRVIDMAPRYENRRFAEVLSRFGIGEGHGTGFDKIVTAIEENHLPPVIVKKEDHGVRVIAWKEKPWKDWEKSEKKKAIYDHVSLRYVNGEKATNESIRQRFGAPDSSKAIVSRLIKECVEEGTIKPADPSAGPRSIHYYPYWA